MSSQLQSDDKDYRSVLASVDKHGRRRDLQVRILWGFWRRARMALAVLLIGFYLLAPWISVGGLPLIRIDIPNRHYIFAGQIFWPQDIFYFLLILLCGIIGTVALVSLLGRVFCGWLCPHNVFLEMVYRPLETLIEGPAHRRSHRGVSRHRNQVKWIVFAAISGALANSAAAIFVGTEAFIGGIFLDVVNQPSAAIFWGFVFAACMFNFGWFREQTCTIVCPYGRLQSVLLDQESISVVYDAQRGEPRGKPGKTAGDCVDCKLCVQVCPTGIDIRNGNQMECIHCAACVDACDSVMTKLHRPIGLVRYASEKALAGQRVRLLRPRSVLYVLVLLGLGCFTAYRIVNRPLYEVTVLRDAYRSQVKLAQDGEPLVMRGYKLSLINKTGREADVTISIDGLPDAELIQQGQPRLAANSRVVHPIFITVPQRRFQEATKHIRLTVDFGSGPQVVTVSMRNGPSATAAAVRG